MLLKRSNSPFRAPPRNASHSPGVNRRTGPCGSLLSRTPMPPLGRPATSTLLLFEKLRELLTQDRSAADDLSGRWSPSVRLSTSLPPGCLVICSLETCHTEYFSGYMVSSLPELKRQRGHMRPLSTRGK